LKKLHEEEDMNELEPIEDRLRESIKEVTGDLRVREDRLRESINKEVTGDLRVRTGGLIWASMTQVMEFAKLMAISGVAVPKHLRGNPGACLGIVTQAINWEMDPFAVANKSYAVSDRLAYESQLINAVILRRAPIVDRFGITYAGDGKTRRCTVSAQIRSGAILEYESPELGTIPTQNSPLWKSDPDQQLFYFASRSFCRRHFPDVLLGVYTRDELEDNAPLPRTYAPKESLSEKLAALASKPERGNPVPYKHPILDASEHDAETGEIVETELNVDKLDADTATVVLAGQLAARQGDAAYQKWWKRLNADDAERAKPHLESIRVHLP
jgi:hypothetical protein